MYHHNKKIDIIILNIYNYSLILILSMKSIIVPKNTSYTCSSKLFLLQLYNILDWPQIAKILEDLHIEISFFKHDVIDDTRYYISLLKQFKVEALCYARTPILRMTELEFLECFTLVSYVALVVEILIMNNAEIKKTTWRDYKNISINTYTPHFNIVLTRPTIYLEELVNKLSTSQNIRIVLYTILKQCFEHIIQPAYDAIFMFNNISQKYNKTLQFVENLNMSEETKFVCMGIYNDFTIKELRMVQQLVNSYHDTMNIINEHLQSPEQFGEP